MRLALVLATLSLTSLLAAAPAAQAEDAASRPAPTARHIDLVLALDTSGSMEGLIQAAREKLWNVTIELARIHPTATLRVALLTFGTPGVGDPGHVVVRANLSDNLDLLSERLFALTTRGGDEYVGRVTKVALDRLSWNRQADMKLLFVAGNESADQDREANFRDEARRAKQRGIIVNAIYCGGADDGDAASWRQFAAAGGGKFANIDHNHGTVRVATPFDKELGALSTRLNGTYVFYGRAGGAARARQARQDGNAAEASPTAAADRAVAKAGGLYRLGSDLVDALKKESFDLGKVAEKDLPENLRAMTLDQRKAYLAEKAKERADLATQVKALQAKRAAYIQAEMKRRNLDDSKGLDRALRDMIREQSAAKGFGAPAK